MEEITKKIEEKLNKNACEEAICKYCKGEQIRKEIVLKIKDKVQWLEHCINVLNQSVSPIRTELNKQVEYLNHGFYPSNANFINTLELYNELYENHISEIFKKVVSYSEEMDEMAAKLKTFLGKVNPRITGEE